MKLSKEKLNDFLLQLSETLSSKNFNPDENLFLIRKRKNQETLLALDFDNLDIINVLSELTEDNYSETFYDTDNDDPPLLNVFGTQINNREVYIKRTSAVTEGYKWKS